MAYLEEADTVMPGTDCLQALFAYGAMIYAYFYNF